MAEHIGFTQLGRRLSSQEKKESSRKSIMSVIIINMDSRIFSMRNLEQVRRMVKALENLGEILFINNDAKQGAADLQFREFPDLRLLIPTEKISYRQCFLLGCREAISPHVLVIDSSCYIESLDFDSIFRAFQDTRSFGVGFQLQDNEGVLIPSVIKAFPDRGRMHMMEGNKDFAVTSLFLKNFFGIYDRKKVLMLSDAEQSLTGIWSALDFFYGAWGRGWITTVIPINHINCGLMPETVDIPAGFRSRIRYYRNEIIFLRRNFLDKESRSLRRSWYFRKALIRLLKFDAALFLAVMLEKMRFLIPGKRIKKRHDAAYSASDIFDMLVEYKQ